MSFRSTVDSDAIDLDEHNMIIDVHKLAEILTPQAKMSLARALCWEEAFTAVAMRLADDINEANSGGDDPDARQAFLDNVGVAVDNDMRTKIAVLERDVARLTAERHALFDEYVECHGLNEAGRYDRCARFQAAEKRGREKARGAE